MKCRTTVLTPLDNITVLSAIDSNNSALTKYLAYRPYIVFSGPSIRRLRAFHGAILCRLDNGEDSATAPFTQAQVAKLRAVYMKS